MLRGGTELPSGTHKHTQRTRNNSTTNQMLAWKGGLLGLLHASSTTQPAVALASATATMMPALRRPEAEYKSTGIPRYHSTVTGNERPAERTGEAGYRVAARVK